MNSNARLLFLVFLDYSVRIELSSLFHITNHRHRSGFLQSCMSFCDYHISQHVILTHVNHPKAGQPSAMTLRWLKKGDPRLLSLSSAIPSRGFRRGSKSCIKTGELMSGFLDAKEIEIMSRSAWIASATSAPWKHLCWATLLCITQTALFDAYLGCNLLSETIGKLHKLAYEWRDNFIVFLDSRRCCCKSRGWLLLRWGCLRGGCRGRDRRRRGSRHGQILESGCGNLQPLDEVGKWVEFRHLMEKKVQGQLPFSGSGSQCLDEIL